MAQTKYTSTCQGSASSSSYSSKLYRSYKVQTICIGDFTVSGYIMYEWMIEWRTLIGAVPMVTWAQSAANWRNTDTRMGRTAFSHTLYINTVTTTLCEAPAQLLLFSACWVFSYFCNPPNSDMYYRIFIVRTWSLWCRQGFCCTVSDTDWLYASVILSPAAWTDLWVWEKRTDLITVVDDFVNEMIVDVALCVCECR